MSKKSHSKTRISNSFSFVAVKKGARTLTHWVMGLALFPCLWGAAHQTGLMIPKLLSEGARSWWLYLAGMATYILIERFIAAPMWLYVFGHELTHAISGVMMGAKIHSFKAKSTGGEVRLSKSNAFIALSPYIVPLYALAMLGIYMVTRRWWNPPQLQPVFQFALGLTLAFHISLTLSAIHKHQSDLKVLGFFLSGVLIVLGNVIILALLGISLFRKTPSLSNYSRAVWSDTKTAWVKTFELSMAGSVAAYDYARTQQWIR